MDEQAQPTVTRYRTIVADPPWLINPGMGRGGRRRNATRVPYSFMEMQEIRQLPVGQLAAPDSVLFLWSTRRLFREGTAAFVAREWGFEPCGEIIWGLRNPGAGSRSIANDHEPVLVARRGRAPLTADEPLGVFFWRQVYEYGPAGVPQKKHSAKPPGFLELVERISPGPYLELFAREARLGWDVWGDEVDSHVDLDQPSVEPVDSESEV